MNVPEHWLQLEGSIYWLTFTAAFLVFAIWESLRPRRKLNFAVERRWTRHGLILIVSTLLSTAAFRATPVAIAVAFAESKYGILNKAVVPFALRWICAVLVLDFARYAAHWSLHATRLWYFHQVHHSDADFDVSTGARVHPLEIILMQAANIATIMLLAPPVSAVLFVEVAASAQSFFNHANISLPANFERRLRWFWVTPDMHRVHHSAQVAEQSRNFADLFPFWDYLFGTYQAEPAGGHGQMMVGMKEWRDERSLGIRWMLLLPFRELRSVLRSRSAASDSRHPATMN